MAWNTQYTRLHMFLHFFIHIAYMLYTYSFTLLIYTELNNKFLFPVSQICETITLLTIGNCMRVTHKILCGCIISLLFPICNVQGLEYIEPIHRAQRVQKKREREINMQVLIKPSKLSMSSPVRQECHHTGVTVF